MGRRPLGVQAAVAAAEVAAAAGAAAAVGPAAAAIAVPAAAEWPAARFAAEVWQSTLWLLLPQTLLHYEGVAGKKAHML